MESTTCSVIGRAKIPRSESPPYLLEGWKVRGPRWKGPSLCRPPDSPSEASVSVFKPSVSISSVLVTWRRMCNFWGFWIWNWENGSSLDLNLTCWQRTGPGAFNGLWSSLFQWNRYISTWSEFLKADYVSLPWI